MHVAEPNDANAGGKDALQILARAWYKRSCNLGVVVGFTDLGFVDSYFVAPSPTELIMSGQRGKGHVVDAVA